MKRLAAMVIAATIALVASPVFADTTSDARDVGLAYGDLTVFILNVAAGNDGTTYNASAEDAVRQGLAEPIAAAYPSLAASDQQALVQLASVDAQLHQIWPTLPDVQRGALRDQWAAQVQPMAANMSCQDFDAMARARLLPSFGQYKDVNIRHLQDCWHQHPELEPDFQRSAPSSTGGHGTYVAMMNANMMNFAANMNIASNIGGGEWTYTVK